jgi:hypothetical protein
VQQRLAEGDGAARIANREQNSPSDRHRGAMLRC